MSMRERNRNVAIPSIRRPRERPVEPQFDCLRRGARPPEPLGRGEAAPEAPSAPFLARDRHPAAVLFLASDLASYITSQLLAVDGGLTGCRG